MTGKARPICYEVRSFNHHKPQVVAQCNSCRKTFGLNIQSSKHPNAVATQFRKKGWQFDPYTGRKCVCPDCLAKEKKQKEAMSNKQTKATTPKAATAAEPPARRGPQDLTPKERSAVRSLLDEHFDDARGEYLDSYSDQRIGKETGVPWAIITKMREAAYGPILVDGSADALREECNKLKERLDKALTDHARTQGALDGTRMELVDLIEKIDRLAQDRA